MPRGGSRPQRTNSKAMPVSGPGKLSQRTDMVPSGGAYGERKAIQEQMSGAPMSKGAPTQDIIANAQKPSSPVVGLFEPSQRPNEPVTAGAPIGPGNSPQSQNNKYVMVSKYLPQLEVMAAQTDAPASFKTFVSFVKTELQR